MSILAHTYLSFGKTYSDTLTVYTQAQITINPCSGESLWGPSCTGLDAKTQGLALVEPPAIFWTQRAAFAHQGNKTYSCSCWCEGFWEPQSQWQNGLQLTEGDSVPSCPMLSTASSCLLTLQESLGGEGWGAAAVTQQCKDGMLLVQIHEYLWFSCSGLAGKQFK